MKISHRRILRIALGLLLPVPLFVGFYFFPYFYSSYHGFDHETQMYVQDWHSLETARQHLKTDLLIFLAMGYLLMGLPSLAYSLLIEWHRMSSRYMPLSYAGWGALLGGLAGLIATCSRFLLTDGIGGSLLAVSISSGVGGMIPVLLLLVRSERLPKR